MDDSKFWTSYVSGRNHPHADLDSLRWLVHKKQYEHMSGALTDRSINMRMGWLFKKQQNIALDKLTDVSIHEGPILSAFGVVRMQFETAGAHHSYLQASGMRTSSVTLYSDKGTLLP